MTQAQPMPSTLPWLGPVLPSAEVTSWRHFSTSADMSRQFGTGVLWTFQH